MISVMIHVLPSFAAAIALHASSADSARGRLLAWAATNVRKHVRGHAGKNAPKRFELHSDPAGKIEEEAVSATKYRFHLKRRNWLCCWLRTERVAGSALARFDGRATP